MQVFTSQEVYIESFKAKQDYIEDSVATLYHRTCKFCGTLLQQNLQYNLNFSAGDQRQ
jgi:hypothetical protein